MLFPTVERTELVLIGARPRPRVLLFGDLVGNFDGLILPRAEILKNAFVLWPLSLIAPDRVHPGVGKSFATLWAESQINQVLAPVAFEWRGEQLTPSDLL